MQNITLKTDSEGTEQRKYVLHPCNLRGQLWNHEKSLHPEQSASLSLRCRVFSEKISICSVDLSEGNIILSVH